MVNVLALLLAVSASNAVAGGRSSGRKSVRPQRVSPSKNVRYKSTKGREALADSQLMRLGGRPSPRTPPVIFFNRNRYDDLVPVVLKTPKRTVETIAAARVTEANVADLFRHEYRPGLLGAKAVVGTLRRDRESIAAFWLTGVGKHGVEFHHRDGAALLEFETATELRNKTQMYEVMMDEFAGDITALEKQLKILNLMRSSPVLREKADQLVAESDMVEAGASIEGETVEQMTRVLFGDLLPVDGAPKLRREVHRELRTIMELSNAGKPRGGFDFLERSFRKSLAAARLAKTLADYGLEGLERADRLEQEAEAMVKVRKQSTLGVSQLLRFVGIQMTAKPVGNRRLITKFDVDSSITSAQTGDEWLTQLRSLSDPEKEQVSKSMSQAINYAHLAIDPVLRGYKKIRVVRLVKLLGTGLTLVPPKGLRFQELRE